MGEVKENAPFGVIYTAFKNWRISTVIFLSVAMKNSLNPLQLPGFFSVNHPSLTLIKIKIKIIAYEQHFYNFLSEDNSDACHSDHKTESRGFLLRTVPPFVSAHSFCASRDIRVSEGICPLIQQYFCVD